MLVLKPHVHGAEGWPVRDRFSLVRAIDEAADQIAADAGSELLAGPSEEERAELRKRVVSEMRMRLWARGDKYKAPDGTRYSLDEVVS